MTHRYDLSVIIPAWNGCGRIRTCLSALTSLGAHIVVVDNASSDETPDIVREEFPDSVLISLPVNRGFAAAVNAGMRATRSTTILLLNQDATVIPGGIEILRDTLKHDPRCGAVSGKIENPDGTLQPSMGPRPHPLRVALDRVPLVRDVIPTHVYRNPTAYAVARTPGWLTGTCLLIRRGALEDVGLFDERYFMYAEDLDWCARARKRGWKLQYLPVRTAVHADEGRRPDRARAKAAWMREGLLTYFTKHGTAAEVRVFRLLLAAERIAKAKRLTIS